MMVDHHLGGFRVRRGALLHRGALLNYLNLTFVLLMVTGGRGFLLILSLLLA
jgi:hypothetical protein